jgi:hypothetical protein
MKRRRNAAPVSAAVWLCISSVAAAQSPLSLEAAPGLPIWRLLGALGLCLVLAVSAAILRRQGSNWRPLGPNFLGLAFRGRSSADRRVSIVEMVNASPTLSVYIVKCDDFEYLVANAPGALLLLNQKAAPKETVQ